MKCAIFKGPHEFRIIERETPVIDEGKALIKVMASGICGSDVHPYLGEGIERRKPGIVMGHEAAGIVEEAGTTKFRKGDRVAINPQIYCGECRQCKTASNNLCDNMRMIGSSKSKFLDGAMCQYISLAEDQLFKLPDNVSFEEGSMLDPVGNAFRVVRRGGVGVGDTVVVIGCGTIGLVTIQTARIAGAAKVIAVDISDYKLGIGQTLGADECINSGTMGAAERILDLTGGAGADVVIEAAGLQQTYELAVSVCKKKGNIVALGYIGRYTNFPIQDLIFKEISLIGSTGYYEESGMVLDYISKGAVRLDKIITHKLPLKEIKKGFDLLLSPKGNAIKVIIKPNEE